MLDPTWTGLEGCSKRLLTQIAANAKQGLSLETAVEGWADARYRRNDYSERRRLGIKSKTTPYVIPDDIATLNKIVKDEDRGRRTSDMFFPEEAKEDRLRVEIVAPTSTSKYVASLLRYVEGRRSKTSTTKRRRVQLDEEQDDGSEEQ